jgi:hypothetical protein
VVAEPLVVPAEQRDVDGLLRRAGPRRAEQHAERLLVQRVQQVVVALDALGLGEVVRAQHLGGALGDAARGLVHLGEHAGQRRVDRGVGVPAAGHLRHVPGQVAHPLERRAHPQRGHDDAQVGGDRLLLGEQQDAALVEVALQRVDGEVVRDHRLGEGQVLPEQRLTGGPDRVLDPAAHRHQVVPELLELGLEDLPHGFLSFARGPRAGVRGCTSLVPAAHGRTLR